MHDKIVTVNAQRTCEICHNYIHKGEKAIYNRSPIYRYSDNEVPYKIGVKGKWMHPWELLCHTPEPERQDCLKGDHEMKEIESSSFDFWEPPTKTGKFACIHCGMHEDDMKGETKDEN